MASSLFSTRSACLSTSFSVSPCKAAISSSFVSSAHFRKASSEPISLSRSSVLPSVECSSRPQKKCTAHHNKTRPKKHRPSDKNRKPPVYPKPPKAPPIITLGWGDEDDEAPTSAVAPQPAAVVGV